MFEMMNLLFLFWYLWLKDWLGSWFFIRHTVHEITAGHRSLSGTITCVTDRIRFLPVTLAAGLQISILYHTQKTGTNCKWPVRSADCRSRCPAVGTLCRSLAIRAGLLYMIYHWNLKTWRSLWPAENESGRSHMNSCRTVTDDRRLFHALYT